MIDHVGFGVADFAKSRAFYLAALAPLGIVPVKDVGAAETGGYEGTGFGDEGRPLFWIGTGKAKANVHVAFAAKTRADVDRFYAAAIAAGGRDNGPPGIRAHYHPDYYGAFVFDPDGNNIEAACRAPA